jgi:hypothetical protein
MTNIPPDRKPLGLLFYRRLPQQDRDVAKELLLRLIDPREYDEHGFFPEAEEDVGGQAARAARAVEARAAWRSDGFVEALLAALVEAIGERHANGTITLCAHPSANSPELVEVPSDWGLDIVAGPDAEPLGYYCDVNASPRPRRAINQKDRYDPGPATLGADLYHKSLHKVGYRVHMSEAVFEQLFVEVYAATKSKYASEENIRKFVKSVIADDRAAGRRPNIKHTEQKVKSEFGKGYSTWARQFHRNEARQARGANANRQINRKSNRKNNRKRFNNTFS